MNKNKFKKKFLNYFEEKRRVKEDYFEDIYNLFLDILITVKKKGIVIIYGNGGSAAESEHFVAELVVKYFKVRKPIAAISLNSSGALLTAHSNDFNYETVFSRQIEAFARKENLFISMSTSGSSKNVISSLGLLNKLNLRNYILTSQKFKDTNKTKKTKKIIVKSSTTSTIQEHHLYIIHLVCEFLDEALWF